MGVIQASPKIALLIDAENTKPDFKNLLNLCRNYGAVKIARIYACRELLTKKIWQKECQAFGLRPVYSERGIKNSADAMLMMDASEILFAHPEITTFIIVSRDTDFIPLVRRLKDAGKQTIGISTAYPPSMLRQCFDEYHTIVRPEWDVFEFCCHLFYLAYSENQIHDEWALAEDVLFSLNDPAAFLQHLHNIGFDSIVGFLRASNSYTIWKDTSMSTNKVPTHFWLRNPPALETSSPDDSVKNTLRSYAQNYFSTNPRSIVFGAPALLWHILNPNSPQKSDISYT